MSHAVYVDPCQPCEDREAILQKARNIGAKSARLIDGAGGTLPRFCLPRCCNGRRSTNGMYLLGTSIARR